MSLPTAKPAVACIMKSFKIPPDASISDRMKAVSILRRVLKCGAYLLIVCDGPSVRLRCFGAHLLSDDLKTQISKNAKEIMRCLMLGMADED